MTSKIKVDNIENQCGGAVVTKCGGTTTITGTVVKSNTLQASDAGNIISQSGTTITLGASGDTINLASGASQTGFGRTGTVDWITTPKTATFTAVSGEGYFCNTSGGAFTANLPAGVAGAIVSFADYAATWQTNALTVTPNGTDKIGSVNANATLSTQGQSVTFVYVDSTQGWINTMDSTSNVRGLTFVCASVSGACNTLITSGDYKIAKFVGPGTFCVSSLSCVPANNVVEYVVVAGGGSGPWAAGGAGGYRVSADASPLPVSVTGYPVTIGAGGATTPNSSNGNNGSTSIFSSITSTGGGGGARFGNPGFAGNSGGSGGGGGGQLPGSPGAGGSGNTPPVSPSQGNNGGSGSSDAATYTNGGGGGGAGGVGVSSSGQTPTPGGIGKNLHIPEFGAAPQPFYPVPTGYFSGGGGGGGGAYNAGAPLGGDGGGGNATTNGTTNSGGGAGGSGGSGGSGIVIIRYKFQ